MAMMGACNSVVNCAGSGCNRGEAWRRGGPPPRITVAGGTADSRVRCGSDAGVLRVEGVEKMTRHKIS